MSVVTLARPPRRWVWTVVLLLSGTTSLAAQCQRAELLASLGGPQDVFGTSVAIDGDRIVVGAPDADPKSQAAGAAYVFRFVNDVWVEEVRLEADDGEAQDRFGTSVAISGNTIVVGAPEDDDGGQESGSAYVFREFSGNWLQFSKIRAADDDAGDLFGCAVAISGLTVIVGARLDDERGTNAGAAYVFENFGGVNWFETHKLLGNDTALGDGLGVDVAIDGEVVVVGADLHDGAGISAGAAYVFRFDGADWPQEDMLLAPVGGMTQFFGRAVDVWLDGIVVGAPGDGAGVAHVFRDDGNGSWPFDGTLSAVGGQPGDMVGGSVAIRADEALAAATLDDDILPSSGGVHLFHRGVGGWVQRATLKAADAASGDNFGSDVALGGPHAVVGARFQTQLGANAGAAYTFRGVTDLGVWENLGQALAGSLGAPCMYGEGALSGNSLYGISVSNVPPFASLGLVFGVSELDAPFKGGVMLPQPSLVVFPIPASLLGALDAVGFWPAGIPAGAQLWLQAWVLDGTGPFGFTSTNGIVATTP